MTELSPHSRTVAEEGTDTAPTPPLSAAGLSLPKNWLAIIAFIWAGQAASMITSYAAGYAVVWYVTESTGSALMLAAMNIAVMLPVGLISPFGGIVADKHNRKLIMIAADGAVGIISLMAGLLILAGDVSIPLLLAVCIARAVGQAFHSPAMMAAMPMLVPDKHLLRINTLDQLLASVASIGAPAFGIFLGHHPRVLLGDVPRFRRCLRGRSGSGPGEDSPRWSTQRRRSSTCWRTCATAGAPLRKRADLCC